MHKFRQHVQTLYEEALLEIRPALLRQRIFHRHQTLDWTTWQSLHVEPELLIVLDLVQPEQVFVDIGANRGAYIHMLQKRSHLQKVMAFEPNPSMARFLHKMFPDTKVVQMAVSDHNGTAQFKIPIVAEKTVHTRGTLRTDIQEVDEFNAQVITVQTVALDDYPDLRKEGVIGLIKIDVEGAEYAALRGMRTLLTAQSPNLVVEIEQRHHPEGDIADIFRYLNDLGYHALYFDRHTSRMVILEHPDDVQDLSGEPGTQTYVNNFVFLPHKTDPVQFAATISQRAQSNSSSAH